MSADFFQSDLSWLGELNIEQDPMLIESKNVDLLTLDEVIHDPLANKIFYEVRMTYKLSEELKARIREGQQARLQRERELGIVRSPSAETRQKISVALTGGKQSEESKVKRSLASTGYVHSEETKLKISIAHKDKQISDETRAKIRAAQQRRKESGYVPPPLSAESRAKIGAAHKGKVMSEETRAKLRAANLGKKSGPRSPETIEKMKLAAKERWVKRHANKANLAAISTDAPALTVC